MQWRSQDLDVTGTLEVEGWDMGRLGKESGYSALPQMGHQVKQILYFAKHVWFTQFVAVCGHRHPLRRLNVNVYKANFVTVISKTTNNRK